MIMAPQSPERYGWRHRNTMPMFRPAEGPGAEVTRAELAQLRQFHENQIAEDDADAAKKKAAIATSMQLVHLSDVDRELLIRWLLNDGRVVFGGEQITAPPRSPE
jgi:hypothetical protein